MKKKKDKICGFGLSTNGQIVGSIHRLLVRTYSPPSEPMISVGLGRTPASAPHEKRK